MKARGFTMFELMVTVSVLAVLTAIAAPSMSRFAAGQRVKAASFDLTSSLLLARNEALKRNGNVQVARSGGNWNNGWQVKVVATDAVLGEQGALDTSLSFDGAPASIVFNANGRVASPADAVQIRLGTTGSSDAVRCIALTLSGQARSSTGECT